MVQAKYVHTNIMAHNWRKLATFYQEVFGCMPVPPMRDFTGEALERATKIPNAAFQGMHLRLPGLGENCRPWKFFSTAQCQHVQKL